MTNYNDGAWHGWNGGECPVHPESVIEWVWHDAVAPRDTRIMAAGLGEGLAEHANWLMVIRFRVVRPYVAPREGWVVSMFDSARQAKIMFPGVEPIRVREVKE